MGDIDLRWRRGFDGDFQVVPAKWQATLVAGSVLAVMVGFTVFDIVTGRSVAAVIGGLITAWLVLTVVTFAFSTRVGKFQVWLRQLPELGLRGDEDLLDLGCGRGAVLLAAAELPAGGLGVDVCQPDQTGNSPEMSLRNGELDRVAALVALHTGDMRRPPFDDRSFDVVLSSFALHHARGAAGRRAVVDEAVRVLCAGGRIVIADLGHTRAYLARLPVLGFADAEHRNLGWRVWWGGSWFPSHVVTGPDARSASFLASFLSSAAWWAVAIRSATEDLTGRTPRARVPVIEARTCQQCRARRAASAPTLLADR